MCVSLFLFYREISEIFECVLLMLCQFLIENLQSVDTQIMHNGCSIFIKYIINFIWHTILLLLSSRSIQ